jgi:SAM-dependent methyltransferase
MRGYFQTIFGDSYADGFEAQRLRPDPEQAAAVLACYAGAGPALELGIDSGRIARPLAARGIEVDGIEISSAMIEELNASVAGLPIRAIQGDFADFEPPRRYSLIYCSFNTFFFIPTRDAQARTFANIARALNDEGVFIIETSVISRSRHIHTGQ